MNDNYNPREMVELAEQMLALVDQHREAPFRSIEWLGEQIVLLQQNATQGPSQ